MGAVQKGDRGIQLRLFTEWLIALLLAASLAAWAASEELAERVDLQLLDIATGWMVADEPDPRIVIVAIDDASLAAIGSWPWPRERHARMVETLSKAGARLAVLDILFTEPSDPASDAALAGALASAGNVVLPFTFVPAPNADSGSVPIFPIPELADAAGTLGHVAAEFDNDGAVRRLELAREAAGSDYPHLMVASYRQAFGEDPAAIAIGRHQVPIIPLRPGGAYPTIPAAALVDGSFPGELLQGKLVLIGASAQGLGDSYPVPERAGGAMSGVEIQANLLGALIADRFVTPLGPSMSGLIAMAVVIALFLGFWVLRPRYTLLYAASLAALVLGAALVLPITIGVWFAPGAALLAIALSYPLWSWRRLVSMMAFLRREGERLGALAPRSKPADIGGFDAADRQMNRVSWLIAAIRRAEVERRQMLEFLSHDMRSPQVAIIGMTGENAPPMPEKERLARVRGQAEQTLKLADDFVQLARVTQAKLKSQEIDLASLALEAADRAYPAASARGISIAQDVGEEPAFINGDPGILSRTVDNLISNAIKYSPEGAQIEVTVEADPKAQLAWLSVADSGPGLPPSRARNPFARFGVEAQAGAGPSVGLGLAFVGEAMERHGAPIHVETAPQEGTRFTLEFPLV